MAEVISDDVPKGYYQLFYVYLFLGSLFFLFATYIDLVRTKAQWAVIKLKTASQRSSNNSSDNDMVDAKAKLPRPRAHYGSFYLRLGAVCKYKNISFSNLFHFSF